MVFHQAALAALGLDGVRCPLSALCHCQMALQSNTHIRLFTLYLYPLWTLYIKGSTLNVIYTFVPLDEDRVVYKWIVLGWYVLLVWRG